MEEQLLIKKYPNRRLYNTENSAYVTLTDVAELVREGRQIKVIDVKTDEEVTAFILTQIILENARKNNSLLPVSLLHLIIRFGENVLSEFFDEYMEQMIHNYIGYKKTMNEQFRICLELGVDFSSMTGKTIQDIKPPFPSFFSPSGQKIIADKNVVKSSG